MHIYFKQEFTILWLADHIQNAKLIEPLRNHIVSRRDCKGNQALKREEEEEEEQSHFQIRDVIAEIFKKVSCNKDDCVEKFAPPTEKKLQDLEQIIHTKSQTSKSESKAAK